MPPDSRWGELIEDRLRRGGDRMDDIEAQIRDLHAELKKNTGATEEVRDLLAAAKGAFRALNGLGIVMSWAGRVAAAGVALYGAFYAVTHGGRPPPGP